MIYFIASFDDGNEEDVKAADLMMKYEVPAIFYWPVNWQLMNKFKGRSYLSEEQADQIAKHFPIGSHTINHPHLTEIVEEEAQHEISHSRVMMIKRFQQPIDTFCYPRGRHNEKVRKMVKNAGYRMARTTQVGNIKPAMDPLSTPTSVHIGYPRKEYGDLHWLTYARKLLAEARKRSDAGLETHFHIWGHGAEITKYRAWAELEKLLREMNG